MNKLPVAVISEKSPVRALLIEPEMKLETLLAKLLKQNNKKSIFLVDDDGKLAGILNIKELLIWGWLHLGLLKSTFSLSERKLRRVARSQVANDLCIPNSHNMVISSQTTVEEAMDALLLSSQNVVAVVDENGCIINDLHIDDLLAYAMHESQESMNV
ncbi:MAG: hypothetical protein CL608_07450 [Anaerolineaceae bacterium]|nr:hypothetical protein [Anaerolineaceae bacterium]